MAVSGLVITLDDDPESQRATVDRLSADARLTLGPPEGNRLPVVAETRSLSEGTDLVEALFAQPGIRFVDVISVDFSDEEG